MLLVTATKKKTNIHAYIPSPVAHTLLWRRGLLGFSDDYIPEYPWLVDKSVHRMTEPCGWVTFLERLKHLFISNREGGVRTKKKSVRSTLVNY